MKEYSNNRYSGIFDSNWVDLDGKPVQRNPFKFPSCHNAHVQWIGSYHEDKGKAVYSDRLFQLDYMKFDRCCMEVFGDTKQTFYDRSPEKINEFLNMYLEKDVKLTVILRGCNASTGFPYWVFIYEN